MPKRTATKRFYIAPELGSTWEQGRRPSRNESNGLSPELAVLAARRLGLASLLYALAYLVDYATNQLAVPAEALSSPSLPMADVVAALAIPIALIVFLVVRSGRWTPRRLGNIGAVFAVIASFGIALQEQWDPWPQEATVRGISWLCVWIAFYPVIVPSAPLRALLTAFASASTAPLAFLLAVAIRGNPVPLVPVLVDLFEPAYLTAALAPGAATVVYGLGRMVSEARKLGSYELVEPLGRGGMGEVWRARHHMLQRPAAIKLIRHDLLGLPGVELDAAVQRFEREAQAIADLQSPHTVELYDFGLSQEGSFYYVMELLNGLDLDTLVERQGPLPPERAIHLLRQVCHSLADAHASGLIHRDIKPANIYVCVKGLDSDFVKVLDFGLVKHMEPEPGTATDLTGRRSVAGTPSCLPPEAALTPDKADHRVDIYGLGCVAYWMLTGRLVFEGDSPMQMIVRHIREAPAPPSSVSELTIPQALDELVLACLEKDPDRRPQTVGEVMSRLDDMVLTDSWTPTRARRWWEAHQPVQGYWGNGRAVARRCHGQSAAPSSCEERRERQHPFRPIQSQPGLVARGLVKRPATECLDHSSCCVLGLPTS